MVAKQRELGLELKVARLRAGIRQFDLAARLGIHPCRLSEIENGHRQPSDDLLNRVSILLHLDEAAEGSWGQETEGATDETTKP